MSAARWIVCGAGFVLAALGLSACEPVSIGDSYQDYVGRQTASAPAGQDWRVLLARPTTRPATAPASAGPLRLAPYDAILMALENNADLAVRRYDPPIARWGVQQQLAAFDPVLTAELSRARAKSYLPAAGGPRGGIGDSTSADISLSEFFPTGTTVVGSLSTGINNGPGVGHNWTGSRAGLTVTQSLLRGYGTDVNLASVRQAQIDAKISQYELRGFAEALVAQVEQTYWNYALAGRQIEIVTESLKVAQKQLDDTNFRIKVGALAQTQRPAAEAEVAVRQEDLINARSILAQRRIQLLRLLNPPGTNAQGPGWDREIVAEPVPRELECDDEPVENHVAVALMLRPDLNHARLAVQRNELQIVKTRNGLLPQLDLFITLGRTGYADSFLESAVAGDKAGYDVAAGMSLQYPIRNRAAIAANSQAFLSKDQSIQAVDNMAQLASVDVRTAHIEIRRSSEQVVATAATRRLQEEKVRAEQAREAAGNSTSLLVAITQRDLLAAQINEVQAVVTYINALSELYRLEGSLLERRGISAPGRQPVTEGPGAKASY